MASYMDVATKKPIWYVTKLFTKGRLNSNFIYLLGMWPASGEIDIMESRGNTNYPQSSEGGCESFG